MEIVSVRCETNILAGCGSVMDVKIKKSGRKNRAMRDSKENYFVKNSWFLKCGGLSAVQVVTQPTNNTSRERCVMN